AVTVHEAGLARAVDPVSGTEGPAVRLVDGEGSAAARQHVLPDAVVLTAETTGPDDPMTPLASTVTLLDPETHEAVWRRPLDDPGVLLAEVALVGDTVVVVGESVHGLDAATGVVRWERAAPALPGPVLAAADGVVVAGGAGALAGDRLLAGWAPVSRRRPAAGRRRGRRTLRRRRPAHRRPARPPGRASGG